MFLLATGLGLKWPVVGQIAAANGVAPGTVATGFSVAGLGGVAGAVASASLATRFGRLLPLIVGTLGMLLALVLVGTNLFVMAAILTMFFWAFALPYYLGLVAEIDATGRVAVFTSAMIPFGMAAGQMAAGPLEVIGGFSAVTVAGNLVLVLALASISWAMRSITLVRKPRPEF